MEKTIQHIFGDAMKNLEAKFLLEVIELNYVDNKTQIKKTKYIDYESFFQAVNRQIRLKTDLMAPGVRYMSRKNGFTYALIEDCAGKREISFHIRKERRDGSEENKTIKAKLCMPPLLVAVKLKEGHGIQDTKVFALKEPIKSMDDPVYKFPFGNAYDDGRFCWGTALSFLSKIKKISQLRSLFSVIYGYTFNDDLGVLFQPTEEMVKEVKSEVDRTKQLWQYLKGKKEFPYECLIKTSTVDRVRQILEGEGRF